MPFRSVYTHNFLFKSREHGSLSLDFLLIRYAVQISSLANLCQFNIRLLNVKSSL
jgi:hypothetical protein